MGMEWGDKAHRHTDKTGASATTSTKTETVLQLATGDPNLNREQAKYQKPTKRRSTGSEEYSKM